MTVSMKDFAPGTVFEDDAYCEHEQVTFCRDAESGLSAIIAVHDTTLGPALGGARMWGYPSSHAALTDVLRLSKGMTYKNALAGIPYGGGKSVILGDPRSAKSEALLSAFGRFVESLCGRYITAEDVGISADDMEVVAGSTRFARGTAATGLGDPSPYTALGVYCGIRAAVDAIGGSDDVAGLTFAVQGLGHVGFEVARLLDAAGARLVVADINDQAVADAVELFGATAARVAEIHAARCDVFVPCALGAVLNEKTIPELAAKAVAGAANNQLATEADGARLQQRGILYAPDYVINAGGVISIALARPGDGDAAVRDRVQKIGGTLAAIFAEAEQSGLPTAAVADRMAEDIVRAAAA